jgi:hypothetical protein
MLKKITFIGIPLLITLSFAQAPDTLWTKTYGGLDYDYGESVQQTTDGGYIVAGFTFSYGAGLDDVWLIKTDENGDTLWTKTYGGPLYDAGFSVQQTPDSGYIVVGMVDATSSTGMVYLIKTDSSGDTLWTRRFGGGGKENGYSVQQTADGGYIIAGYTMTFGPGYAAFYLIKTDSLGIGQWERTYGEAEFDFCFTVQETSDYGFIISGFTTSFGAGGQDAYLIKTNSQGDTLWTKTHGGTGDDGSYSGIQTSDGGYIITGYTSSFGSGGTDVYVVKTDGSGDTLWTKTFGGSQDDWGWSIKQTADSGYIIAGGTRSFGAGGGDAYFIKLDGDGNALWTTTFGGTSHDDCQSVQQTTDLGYIACGWTYSFGPGDGGVWLIKIAPDVGVGEGSKTSIAGNQFGATILSGPLLLPEGKNCKIFDIMGRIVVPDKIKPGVYFVYIDNKLSKKVIKVR